MLCAAAALTALAALGVWLVNTAWFERAVQRRLVAKLENLSGGRVEVREFQFRPAALQITFRGLIVHGPQLPAESPLASAENVVLRLSLASLVRRKLALRSLDVDDAEIHFYTRADGSTNLPAPSGRFDFEALAHLSIGRLALARTRLYWNDQHWPLDLTAQDVTILLRHNPPQHYSGRLSSSEIVIKTSERSLPPLALAAQFGLSSDGVDASSLVLQSAGLRGEGTFSLSNWASPEGRFSFRVSGAVAELAQTLRLGQIRKGRVTWEIQGSYRKGEFVAKGRVEARGLSIQSLAFQADGVDLATDYSGDSRHIELTNLTFAALGGTGRGQAEVSLADPVLHAVLHMQFRGLLLDAALRSFPALPAALKHPHLASEVNGTLEASWDGQGDNLQSQFDLQMQPPAASRKEGCPLSGFMRGNASAARGVILTIKDAKLQTPHSTFTGYGTLGEGQAGLSFRLATVDFEEWRLAIESLTGSRDSIPLELMSEATFTGQLMGPMARRQVRGRLEAGRLRYKDWIWDGLTAEVLAAPDRLEVTAGRLRRNESTLVFTGAVGLENWQVAPDAPARLAARLERAPLAGLGTALGIRVPVNGLVTGWLEAAGAASNLSGSGEIRVERGAVAGEPFDSLSARLRIAESVCNFENVQLTKVRGRLEGQARIALSNRAFWLELRGAHFSLAEMKRLAEFRNASGLGKVGGYLDFNLRAQGTPDDVALLAMYGFREVSLNGESVGDLEGQIDWKGERIRLEGQLQGPAGTARFAGAARAQGDWPLQLSGQYADLRAETWLRSVLKTNITAHVTASGAFTVTGPMKKPSQLEVQGQAQSLEVSYSSLTWKNERPVDLHYTNRTLALDRFKIRGPSTDLEIEGSINFKQPAALSLTARGKADATLLSLFDPALQASGQSEVKVRLSGGLERPALQGVVEVQNASLGYADLPFRLTGLKGEVTLEGDRATLRSLRGTSGGGVVLLSGFLTLAQSGRLDLGAELKGVRVPYPAEFTSVLDGSLHLVGLGKRGQLDGQLSVRHMSAPKDFNWLARLGEAGNFPAARAGGIPYPLAGNIRLNVQVSSPQTVRLETRDLRLTADIDLRVQGTLANPVQVGTIHIPSGEVIFRGNRYRLNRADLSMINPFRTQVVVDLEAQTRLQRYDLTLDISGPLDRLKISYRSDPPLPTADIVSLLAFGYARQQEEMATTAAQPLRTVGASALLSEALSTQVSGRIQRLFGVSRIKVDPNVGGLAGAGSARVTVEQQVSRDLTLTYVTTTASSQQRIIQFEWALSDRISLVGARDQNGILGMELKLRHRFK